MIVSTAWYRGCPLYRTLDKFRYLFVLLRFFRKLQDPTYAMEGFSDMQDPAYATEGFPDMQESSSLFCYGRLSKLQ